ncbi:hypothetical protein SAMN05216411_101228 [Nitrosospira multiformis]|nr:hypothetical protein SAMN05216411_101228 [Nitrosospira multiformis]
MQTNRKHEIIFSTRYLDLLLYFYAKLLELRHLSADIKEAGANELILSHFIFRLGNP